MRPTENRDPRRPRWLPGLILLAMLGGCSGGATTEPATVSGVDNTPAPSPAPDPNPTPVPTLSFNASPTSVAANGSATLTWSTTNATGCSASDGWQGTKAPNGSASTGALAATRGYTLTCTGSGGSATRSVTVTVAAAPPPPPPPQPTTPAPTVSLTVNPATVTPNSVSTITWSATNATSCTASDSWSGSRPTSGQESTGVLSATRSYTLSCIGAGGTTKKTASVFVTQATGGLTMPSLEDERATYSAWGWTWNTSAEPGTVTEPLDNYYVTGIGVHGDPEGDDLWSYLMAYRRTGNTVYLNRAKGWLRYFRDEYRTSPDFDYDRGFLLDHLFGWGLVAWYEHTCQQGTCDTAALAEAENIAAEVEDYWNDPDFKPGSTPMSTYGLRQGARHLLLATRVAEATGKQRWITLRDKLIDLWLQSPDWDSARGMYFTGSYYTDEDVGTGAYANGARIVPSFHIGILTEAFDHAYRLTGRTTLRDRMVAMARFVDKYGLDANYQYTGKTFGIANGANWHSYSASCGTNCSFWDPVYTTSLVNTLVRGYLYSGDRSLYDRAKHFFNRGTKGIYGEPIAREVPDNQVHHFVDTRFVHQFWLDYNKGELQYTYLIFTVR